MVVSIPLFTHEFCIILHDHYVWLVKIWCVWLIEIFAFFSILWCFGVFNSHITFSVAIIGTLRRKGAKELGASNKALQSLLVSQQTIIFVTFFYLIDEQTPWRVHDVWYIYLHWSQKKATWNVGNSSIVPGMVWEMLFPWMVSVFHIGAKHHSWMICPMALANPLSELGISFPNHAREAI